MTIDILFVDKQVILAATALMPSAMAVIWTPCQGLPPQDSSIRNAMPSRQISVQGINTPATTGTDHTPTMAPDIGDISAGHSPAPIPTTAEAAVLEDTPRKFRALIEKKQITTLTPRLLDSTRKYPRGISIYL